MINYILNLSIIETCIDIITENIYHNTRQGFKLNHTYRRIKCKIGNTIFIFFDVSTQLNRLFDIKIKYKKSIRSYNDYSYGPGTYLIRLTEIIEITE